MPRKEKPVKEKKPKKEKRGKGEPREKMGKKKQILIILILVVVLAVAAVAAFVIIPRLRGGSGDPGEAPEHKVKYNPETWNLILVNNTHILPGDFTVDLEEVPGGRVATEIAKEVREMLEDAKSDGVELQITSSFRNVKKQTELFEQEVARRMAEGMNRAEAEKAASRYVQPPKYSEHHTGLAVDIIAPDYQTLDEGFATTNAYRWLTNHAEQYGFILRYPKDKEEITGVAYEPWHYRYVGILEAHEIADTGVCFEEYLSAQGVEGAMPAPTPSPTPEPEPESSAVPSDAAVPPEASGTPDEGGGTAE